jgi:3-oxoisoapionate decarboxylase
MNRRQFLLSAAGGSAAVVMFHSLSALGAAASSKSKLGIADYSFNIRNTAKGAGQRLKPLEDPLDFLQYCQGLGAGGAQMEIGIRDSQYSAALREYAEAHGMFIEGSASLPKGPNDIDRFTQTIRTAKQAGAKVVRLAIGGRRYEQFGNFEQFKAFMDRSLESLQLAEPIAAGQQMPLAIENHKDWRIDDLQAILKRLDSTFVGVCIDTGNSFALLEDPLEVVKAYAPWAFSVHLKDMAVCEYEEGFLLADVPLGEGLLDLKTMIDLLQKAKPGIQFSLEMATRDPLKVPCLTEKFIATFADLPARDLAYGLRYVRNHARDKRSFPSVSSLPIDEQIKLEEDNIRKCLRYASEHLAI